MAIGKPRMPASHDGAGMAPGLSVRQVAAVVAGNAIEFYDFVTYAFFATQIGHTFFPPTRRASACWHRWRLSVWVSSPARWVRW